MICPHCEKLGATSTVRLKRSGNTLLDFVPGYFDKQGKWVPPIDRSIVTTQYCCSNGHDFSIKEPRESDSPKRRRNKKSRS